VTETSRRRKLIEVALPLDEINAACKADKDRKTGTIRNLHKWFAPMPLPAWRALLFAALIDDPEDDNRRVYLLDLIKQLVKNGADLPDEEVLHEAKAVLAGQFPNGVPTVMDPFCGGGSTLVEAQRLGLPAFGSDLNPVPTLISRTLVELLPKVYGQQPLHPEEQFSVPRGRHAQAALDVGPKRYNDYEGVLRDVSYYAEMLSDEGWKSIADNYAGRDGERVTAWLWARTAACPNPACGIETVLTTSWLLSKRKGDTAWIQPKVVGGKIELSIVAGADVAGIPSSPKIGNGVFACIACSSTLDSKYLRKEGKSGRLGLRMTAVVSDSNGRRTFRAAGPEDTTAANRAVIDSSDSAPPLVGKAATNLGLYGMETWDALYTARQWHTLTVFADLVAGVKERVIVDGGTPEYADTISTLLGLSVGRMSQYQSSQVRWFIDSRSGGGQPLPAFGRHDLAMPWDFAEPTPRFGAGSIVGAVRSAAAGLVMTANGRGRVIREDARRVNHPNSLIATDPPYFEAISYADLSDYFYVWHRRALRNIHPDLYATIATPKADELTALSTRHNGDAPAARNYFISGFTEVFTNLQTSLSEGLPMLVVYASKEKGSGKEEIGRWSSILTAALDSGLEITGTWPVHGTGGNRMVGIGANAVATYIVLVCRPRSASAMSCSLTDFNRALRRELGPAVRDLQAASILPVDLAQAAMGPGMQIYSRYRAVLDQSGSRVPVEQALRLINAALSEVLDEQEGELDPESRFAVRWWETHGWDAGTFGEADKTVRPLGISVDDVVRAQVVTSHGNKVQLTGSNALDHRWAPSADIRPTAWEAVHHLANRLIDRGGELEAAGLMATLGNLQDPAMALVYRLHDIAAKKGRTGDQERYNALINSWTELVKLSADQPNTIKGLF
jgi:putative DNA methylase